MNKVWGSSPTDVYVVGDVVQRYDGAQWTPVALPPSGVLREFHDIIGFSRGDIWIVGERYYPNPSPPPNFLDSSLIAHFDGIQWRESQRLPTKGARSVWGTSSTNLYVGSADGKILHYDGVSWIVNAVHSDLQVISLGGDGNVMFAGGSVSIGFPDTQMIYGNISGGWYLVDQQPAPEHFSDPRFGPSAVFSPAVRVIYSSGWGLFRWENNQWTKLFQWGYALRDIAGDRSDNVFVVGWEPTVFHWNGQDWKRILAAEQLVPMGAVLSGAWTDGNEVFIVGDDGWRSYVLRGR